VFGVLCFVFRLKSRLESRSHQRPNKFKICGSGFPAAIQFKTLYGWKAAPTNGQTNSRFVGAAFQPRFNLKLYIEGFARSQQGVNKRVYLDIWFSLGHHDHNDKTRRKAMTEEMVNVAEAKKHFSELLGRVAFGKEHILITKRGKPMARLVPADETNIHLSNAKGWLLYRTAPSMFPEF